MANSTYQNINDKEANQKATIATVITALLLLLMLIFVTFSIDAKRDDLEEGILVNFGTSNVGSGEIQPQVKADSPIMNPVQPQEQPKEAPAPKPQTQPKAVAQPATKQPAKQKPALAQKEETAVISTPKKESTKKADTKSTETNTANNNQADNTQPKPVDKPSNADEQGTAQTETLAPPAPKQPSRVYGGKKNVPSSGEGNDNQAGDKGQPDGSPDKGAYTGTNSGLGDSGVGYNLSGRKLMQEPSVQDNSNIQGKITVNIKVDQNGNVIAASLGKPTTISNNSLIQKSIAAAKRAKFDKNRTASEEQFGTMTFVYKVR